MKALQRTLAILACLCLAVQAVRHAYVLWLLPRTSVLDRFERPMKGEIAAAGSLDELLRRYEPLRREADRLRAEPRGQEPKGEFGASNTEPFKSEAALCEAIRMWEARAKEVREVRFYGLIGLILAAAGLLAHARGARWLGTILLVISFSELVFWTSPTFLGDGVQEFDRLVTAKLVLSVVSMGLMALSTRLLGVFEEQR